jgi:hypothetical protein
MNMEFEDVQDLPKVFNFLIALPWSSLFLLEILPAVCHLGPQNDLTRHSTGDLNYQLGNCEPRDYSTNLADSLAARCPCRNEEGEVGALMLFQSQIAMGDLG